MVKINPPQIEYPNYTPHCLGWKMGDGEDYIYDWYEYIDKLTKNELKEYFNEWKPPKEWTYILKHFKGKKE